MLKCGSCGFSVCFLPFPRRILSKTLPLKKSIFSTFPPLHFESCKNPVLLNLFVVKERFCNRKYACNLIKPTGNYQKHHILSGFDQNFRLKKVRKFRFFQVFEGFQKMQKNTVFWHKCGLLTVEQRSSRKTTFDTENTKVFPSIIHISDSKMDHFWTPNTLKPTFAQPLAPTLTRYPPEPPLFWKSRFCQCSKHM